MTEVLQQTQLLEATVTVSSTLSFWCPVHVVARRYQRAVPTAKSLLQDPEEPMLL